MGKVAEKITWGTFHPEGVNRFISYPGFFQVAFATFNVVSKKFYLRFGFNVGQPQQNPPAHSEHKDSPLVGEVLNLGINRPKYMDLVLKTDENVYHLEAGNFPSTEEGGTPFLLRVTDIEQENMFVKKFFIFNYAFGTKGMVFPQKWGGYFSSSESSGKFELDFNFTSFGAFSSERSLSSYITSTSSLNWTRGNAEVFVVEIPSHLTKATAALYLKPQKGKVNFDLTPLLKDGYTTLQEERQKEKSIFFFSDNKEYVVLDKVYDVNLPDQVKYRRLHKNIKRPDLLKSVFYLFRWLKCYSPKAKTFFYPVNREWIEMIANVFKLSKKHYKYGPLQFLWDTSFLSLMASYFDVELSREILRSIFSYQDAKTGFIPQLVLGDKKNTISNPPIYFLSVWMLYKRSKDKSVVEEFFPYLDKNFSWWCESRDPDQDLLFQWGAETEKAGKGKISIQREYSPFFESGMDNSPVWENAELEDKLGVLNLTTVDVNSYLNLASLLLSKMAQILGEKEKVNFYENFYQKQKVKINESLWNAQIKMYGNKYLKTEKFDYNYAPTSFYPFLSFVPDTSRAREMIELNLTNQDMFWDDFLLPSISKNNIYFSPDGDYWMGRIWPPINYLIYLGTKNYNNRVAYEIALSSLMMYEKEWSNEGHIHENYSSETGWGEPFTEKYARTCPYYSWGGLMPLIFLEEVFSVELWEEGYRAGSLYHREKVELLDYKFHKDLPPVSVLIYPPDSFQLKLGNLLVVADTMVELRKIIFLPQKLTFKMFFATPKVVLKLKGMTEGRYYIKAESEDSSFSDTFKLTPSVGISFEFSKKETNEIQEVEIVIESLEENSEAMYV